MAEDIVLGGKKKAGAKVFDNPDNISPKADTDAPDVPKLPVRMDISNPEATFKEHPLEHLTKKPTSVRHSYGRGIPKDHPAIKEQ